MQFFFHQVWLSIELVIIHPSTYSVVFSLNFAAFACQECFLQSLLALRVVRILKYNGKARLGVEIQNKDLST